MSRVSDQVEAFIAYKNGIGVEMRSEASALRQFARFADSAGHAGPIDADIAVAWARSGEKVWYRTGADGWWEPLAVQDEEPEGADGNVVARDWAYVDRLGVMEPGAYQAYALFDEGAGFAPTALAEATVEVRAADAAPTKPAPAKASSSPKTGDLSPLAIGGLALAALLGAGALALSLARRRA